MYSLIVFLPLLGAVIAGLLSLSNRNRAAEIVTVSGLLLSLLFSIIAFTNVAIGGQPETVNLARWISSGSFVANWSLRFDTLTAVMLIVVTGVSSMVHIYSIGYMSHDNARARFMAYLSLFTFAMLMLVTADNLVQMFFGWEGVGVASYLLIGFWYKKDSAHSAAMKAFVVNRVGDFGFALGILAVYALFGSVQFDVIFAQSSVIAATDINFLGYRLPALEVAGILLFIGAMGKSAQLGLHTWLPDAMEGPTPVSALIHAATLVTAGVFLIARSSFLFELAPNVLEFVAVMGAMTAFFASSVGLLQNDLKKVIAYSTCSQLGYMVFSCGCSDYSAGVFHLANHAFFKALLFLGAGAVIHAVNDEQDMRKMGGLKNLVPFTYSAMTIGSLALIGFPFLAGFYSKDLVLELAYGKFTPSSHFSYWLGTFGAFLTAFYSTRLACLTFLVKPNGYRSVIGFAQETFSYIFIALCFLTVPSIFVGFIAKDMVVGVGSDFFGTAIYNNPKTLHVFDAEFVEFFYKILPVTLSLLGATLSFILYNFQSSILFYIKTSFIGRKVYSFLNKKWFFDTLYNELFGQFFFKFGYSMSYKLIDRGTFEIIGPTGLSSVAMKTAHQLHKAQTGSLYHYTLIILTTLTLMLCVRHLWSVFGYSFDYRGLVLIVITLFFVSSSNR